MRALAALLLLACGGTLPVVQQGPPPDADFTRFYGEVPRTPTTMHSFIYAMMEECVGVKGDFSLIRWFDADFVINSHFQRVGGIWIKAPRIIVIDAKVFSEPPVISHEIIHDLLGGGNADHDDVSGDTYFERCTIKQIVD